MFKTLSFFISFSFLASLLFAQTETSFRSVHYKDKQYFDALIQSGEWVVSETDAASQVLQKTSETTACSLKKVVYGWHPYWQNSASVYNNYQWNLISHLAYFDAEVDAATGNFTTTNNWETASVITQAQNNGVKVHLTATLFANHATLWANSAAQTTLINNIVTKVQARNASGVNIDFEGMGNADKAPFTNFMSNLCTAMHTQIPNSEVTVALYSVDWSSSFDMAALSQFVDFFVIMGYDYYWSGSTQAGPTDPLYEFVAGDRCISRSVTYYLNAGCPKEKLCLGLPYYGRKWQTQTNNIPANTVASTSSALTYASVRNNTSGYYTPNHRYWHEESQSQYYSYQDTAGNWQQLFINEPRGLQERFQFTNYRDLKGIGIWALGSDNGYIEYWKLIEQAFSDCGLNFCQDTLYDMGGVARNYYNNENYTFTLNAPDISGKVTLNFASFNTEQGNDVLSIYDGSSTNAPLIGSYSGTTLLPTIQSTNSALTLQFTSNGSVTSSGWKIYQGCVALTGNEIASQNDFNLYPNPAQSEIWISSLAKTMDIVIENTLGQSVLNCSLSSDNGSFHIDISAIQAGLYLIKSYDGKTWKQQKLVKL